MYFFKLRHYACNKYGLFATMANTDTGNIIIFTCTIQHQITGLAKRIVFADYPAVITPTSA